MNLLLHGKVFCVALITTTVFCSQSNAQRKTQLMGKLIGSGNKAAVPYALISNKSSSLNAFSDSLGLFTIPVTSGDTILISRIGFFPREVVITEVMLFQNKSQTIELQERSYQLNTVSINSLGTYQQFKYKVLNTEPPRDENQINPEITKSFNQKITVLEPQARISLGSPVTALYMLMSKEGKSLRKLDKELEKDQETASYKEKYSPAIVTKITGLKELELEKFMKYCKMDINFIRNSNDYEITAKVLECFKSFQEEQKLKEKEKKPEPGF